VSTRYIGLGSQSTNAFQQSIVSPVTGTSTTMTARISANATSIFTFQVVVNGVNSGSVLTILVGNSTATITNALAIAQGDTITIQCIVAGTPSVNALISIVI
jgi:hypothetical protein